MIRGPRSTINLRIWAPPGAVAETSILFPGPLHLGGGITLNQVNTSYRITVPVEAEHVLDLVTPALPSGGGDPGVSLDAHLTQQTAAVLAAVLDLGRAQLAAGPDDVSFVVGDVARLLEQEWVEVGLDQIRTHVATATLSAEPLPPGVVDSELAGLTRIGIVRVDQNRFALSGPLQAVARLTVQLGGGLRWQRVTERPGGELHWSDRLLLYGDGGLIISVGPTLDGYVALQTLTRRQTLDFIAGELRSADITDN